MAKNKKGKDPAFLMYSGDFLAGTYTMNYEQKGKYITLMCIHHQKGFVTEIDLQSVLSDTDILIASKFYKSDDGNYYNQKMVDVIEERKVFTESRRINGSKGGRPKTNHKDNILKPNGYPYGKPNDNHTGDEDENENQDINKAEYTSADIIIATKQLDNLTEYIDDNNIPAAKKLLSNIKEDYGSFDNILQLCYGNDTALLKNWTNYFNNTLQFIN
jgi:hypothetical protein